MYQYDILFVVLLDKIQQDEEPSRIVLPLFIIYALFAIFGIILAIICLVFNLWFSNQKYVIYICCSGLIFLILQISETQ